MANEQYKHFDCYKVLGVSPKASPHEIRNAYKQASFRGHPDRGGSHDAQVRVNLAYEVLSDPIQRQVHDIHWRVSTTSGFTPPQSPKPDSTRQTYTPPRNASSETKQTTTETRRPPPRRETAPQGTKSDSTRQTYTPPPRKTPSESKQTPPKATWPPPPRETLRREPLAGLKQRMYQHVEQEKHKIWQDLNNRTERNENDFKQKYSAKRQEVVLIFLGGFALGGIALITEYSVLWLGVAYLGRILISRLGGIQIANRNFPIFDTNVADKIRQYAQEVAKESCSKDVNNLEKHFSTLASLTELLLRPSTFDDSEEQVARRLTAAFFLMGYTPIQYDRENRTLLFTDGDEKIIVRFRHRSGNSTNITFVEKLVAIMWKQGAAKGFLFCSPGLSGNAANYASAHKVKWYTLETMNTWINQVLVSEYDGPSGNVLANLDKLQRFLATISPQLAARSHSPHARYR